jgi:predicted CXXCH cytochrome family protein
MIAQGECKKCHDSHGSDNEFILVTSGNQLCLECHKEINQIVTKAVYKHEPLRKDKGCLNCHVPHASTGQLFLLKDRPPALCKTCHQTEQPVFTQKHQNYPVADSNCISCHDPHGSDIKGMLYANSHEPVRNKNCTECHQDPNSPSPLKINKQGTLLCRQCHREMIELAFSKNRLHWPLVDYKGCLNCHAPHGAKQKKLLNGTTLTVCGKCHADTVELQAWSKKNPKNKKLCEPVKTGNCISCHAPHSSDNILLFNRSSINAELCGGCHEWQTHSTHPIGDKVIDQRNKNLTLDCLSCHKGCGTSNKPSMLHYELTEELCIQCHTDRKR